MRKIILTILLLITPSLCLTETIKLKSGKFINAPIIERTDEYIVIDMQGVSLTYYFDEIESIDGQTTTQALVPDTIYDVEHEEPKEDIVSSEHVKGFEDFKPTLNYDSNGPAAVYLKYYKEKYNSPSVVSERIVVIKKYFVNSLDVEQLAENIKEGQLENNALFGKRYMPPPSEIESVDETIDDGKAKVIISSKEVVITINMVKEGEVWKIKNETSMPKALMKFGN